MSETKDVQREVKHLGLDFSIKNVGDEGEFEGYGSVTDNVDQGGDIVEAGAFANTIENHRRKGKMPKMLYQHSPSQVIGVWTDMAEDDRGLYLKGRLITETTLGKDVYALMKAEAIDGLSIGYRTIDYEWTGPNSSVRSIKELELWEVSVVTFPMNPEATVDRIKHLDSKGDVERILREAGVPGSFAKLVALHGYDEASKRVSGRREADGSLEKALNRLSATTKRSSEIYNA